MAKAYPAVLLLENKRAIVVGGGSVAERKVKGLLECAADVTIVSPRITEGLQALVRESQCAWKKKCYEGSDVQDAEIVFAATDDEEINARVFHDATEARLMVNVADRPELCSFYLPSVLRRGSLSIAVSTQGASPLLARRIRLQLEERFSARYEGYVDLLQSVRDTVNGEVAEQDRMAFWEAATDGRILELLEDGDAQAAEVRLQELVSSYSA
ncbi:MAG: bifunctional precorrin-2 dehydrogenase/sirohydrochlorin ferrochelatase [Gordonibacter sp.]|uniref:precorrin-2 dehydrogenase/sirohydrochlorin ferrochelatase family protein n=1 Tax=Gordonibacter sp. TaxID=1968902 RepID=UPI002FCA0659